MMLSLKLCVFLYSYDCTKSDRCRYKQVELWTDGETSVKEEGGGETPDKDENEEDEFVRIYGNDVNTSGIWEPVRSYADDRDRLENISLQVHRGAMMAKPDDEIDAAMFDTRTLLFTRNGFKDIKLDVIKYHIKRAPQNYIYLGKGMEPACVHMLIKVDTRGLYFFLGKHICNITL